jgi:transposase
MNTSLRPFTTNNIKQCEKFKQILRKLYKKSKIFDAVKQLEKRFQIQDAQERQSAIKDCIKYSTIAGELIQEKVNMPMGDRFQILLITLQGNIIEQKINYDISSNVKD